MQQKLIWVGLMAGISSFGYSASASMGHWQVEAGATVVDQSELITTHEVSDYINPYYYNNISGTYTTTGEDSSEDTSSIGFYLGVGYSFSFLDVGATFYNFGEASVDYTRSFHQEDDNYDGNLSATGKLNLNGIGFYVRKPLHITDSLMLSPKLGLLFWKSSSDVSLTLNEGPNGRNTWKDSGSQDGTDLYASASVSYMFTDRMGINADWTYFSLDGYNANSVGLGIVLSVY